MIVYKMGPKGFNQHIEKDPTKVVECWLNDDAMPGDIIEVEVMEMTENEYESLPEYMGP